MCGHQDVVGRDLKAVCERRDTGLVLGIEAMLCAVPYPVRYFLRSPRVCSACLGSVRLPRASAVEASGPVTLGRLQLQVTLGRLP